MSGYDEFLRAKMAIAPQMGFYVDAADIHPILKPHQADIVRWACAGGRRAVFAAFGLGKSVIQLEIMRQVLTHRGGYALIICPLGVRQEFIRDAAMLGTKVRFIRRTDELDGEGLYLTNYESVRDGRLDPNEFDAVSLDEASVLPLQALKAGRRGRAAELNEGYFLDGVKYLEAQERTQDMPSLFDLTGDAA